VTDEALSLFHPAVSAWFRSAFPAPTPAQVEAWPAIREGRNTLVAAPTGSGKTLAAFLAAIDDLVREGVRQPLADETYVVYVSPLKALANDIERNLRAPLAGIRTQLQALGHPDVEIRTVVRTGDTSQSERTGMRRRAPHIVVTTPESLYILLTSASGRKMLATTRSVIVDEIHAVAPNKRGSHLALTLERLAALAGPKLVRIGLSATQKPIDEIMYASATWRSSCRRRRSRPSCRARSGRRCTTAWRSSSGSTARRSSSSIRAVSPSVRRAISPSGSVKGTSPRTTAACRASTGSTPSSA
jgi:ATP-dependent Lhr-like helicase